MNMSKKYILLFATVLVLFQGCMENFLERDSYGSIDENTFFTQKEHVDLATIACYSKLRKLNSHWGEVLRQICC